MLIFGVHSICNLCQNNYDQPAYIRNEILAQTAHSFNRTLLITLKLIVHYRSFLVDVHVYAKMYCSRCNSFEFTSKKINSKRLTSKMK